MKLTKTQRYIAYCCMLAEFENFDCTFFCHAANHIGLSKIAINDSVIKKYLPELWKKKPKEPISLNCWFFCCDHQIRKNILKKCIKETHPK